MNFLTLEQFAEMWRLQDSLNSATSGPDWKEKKQNWNLAIKSEVMEFFDYIGWKWWKEPDKVKKPSDMQARLEAVDIWHFLLSSIIEISNLTIEEEHNRFKNYADIESNSAEGCLYSIQRLDSTELNNCNKIALLTDMLQFCSWTWDELYKAYIGKVALNNFRQANGYKEGTYQKIWCTGKLPGEEYEDNFYLEQILQKLKEDHMLSYSNVYAQLAYRYATRPNR